jgi:hypothetical protein
MFDVDRIGFVRGADPLTELVEGSLPHGRWHLVDLPPYSRSFVLEEGIGNIKSAGMRPPSALARPS